MVVPAPVTRPTPQSVAVLRPVAAALALGAALVVVPFRAASAPFAGGYAGRAALVEAIDSGFIRFWHDGTGVLPADLGSAVDFWMRFHVVKAGLAAALLAVLVHLGLRAWAALSAQTGAARRALAGATAVATWTAALVALLVLVANIQGSIAPLSSALGLLPIGAPDPALAETLAQVRHGVAADPGNPAVRALLGDFATYHRAMAGLSALTAAAHLAAAALLWRTRRRTAAGARRGRALLVVAIGTVVTVAGLFAVVAAANLSTGARPGPALLGFLDGSL